MLFRSLVEFFERELLRLGYEEEDQSPADYAPRGVPPERSLGLERAEETREGERDDLGSWLSFWREGKEGDGRTKLKSQVTAVA